MRKSELDGVEVWIRGENWGGDRRLATTAGHRNRNQDGEVREKTTLGGERFERKFLSPLSNFFFSLIIHYFIVKKRM